MGAVEYAQKYKISVFGLKKDYGKVFYGQIYYLYNKQQAFGGGRTITHRYFKICHAYIQIDAYTAYILLYTLFFLFLGELLYANSS